MSKKQTVNLSEFNITPDTGKELAALFNKCLSDDKCKGATVYKFQNGTYRFYASEGIKEKYNVSDTEFFPYRTLAFLLKDKKEIIIDGDGSKFIFYGHCQPFTFDGCENVTLKNLSIDWEKPLSAEGTVVGRSNDYIDIKIDTNLFPCYVRDFCLYFEIGDGEESSLTYGKHTVYDASTMTVSPGFADNIMIRSAEHLGDDIFRLYFAGVVRENDPPKIGDVIVLRHGGRIHSGIFAQNCKNIEINNVVIHSSGGIGAVFQYCENIKCDALDFVPNVKVGRRVVSTHDEGICVCSCRGSFEVLNSCYYGCQDSSINVYDMGVSIIAILDQTTIQCSFVAGYDSYPIWVNEGQKVAFVDKTTLRTLCVREVVSFTSIDDRNFIIKFSEGIPRELYDFGTQEMALDNIDNCPSVHLHNNFFGSTRSRGVLVTTGEKVVIEKNVFESAGAAVLISGDMNLWHKTGSCNDVTIANNVFTDYCTLSEYFDSYAMISICPHVAKSVKGVYYHKNIKIENNTFITPDTPVLYSFNTDNLSFVDNSIVRSSRRGVEHTIKNLITARNCNDLKIYDNSFTGNFKIDKMKIENCTDVVTKSECIKEK